MFCKRLSSDTSVRAEILLRSVFFKTDSGNSSQYNCNCNLEKCLCSFIKFKKPFLAPPNSGLWCFKGSKCNAIAMFGVLLDYYKL